MKVKTKIELTIDGNSADWKELSSIWGKALDPINALKDAPGSDVGECQPFIWGMLATSNWKAPRLSGQWSDSVWQYDAEPDPHWLTCEIEARLMSDDHEAIVVRVCGEVNGESIPDIVATRRVK